MTVNEAPQASRREWVGLAVLALPCLLHGPDSAGACRAQAQRGPQAHEFPTPVDYGRVLVPAGQIPDYNGYFGRLHRAQTTTPDRAAAFGAASVIAAFSDSAEMLIITRAVLGVAGATLAPSSLSLIRNLFLDSAQRAFAIGVWATSFAVGAAIGPLAGGLLLEFFWWG